MKIVINDCFGGFGLSDEAQSLYAKKKGFKIFRYKQTSYKHNGGKDEYTKIKDGEGSIFSLTFTKDLGDKCEKFPCGLYWHGDEIVRTDPNLIEVIEELGEEANGPCASLKIIEIPDGIDWEISEYDGNEHVAEKHNKWS